MTQARLRKVSFGTAVVLAVAALSGCGPAGAAASDESDIKMVGGWCAQPYHDDFSGRTEGSIGESHDGLPDNNTIENAMPIGTQVATDSGESGLGIGDSLVDDSYWLTAILSPGDVDWYKFEARDETKEDLEPHVDLEYGGSGDDKMYRPDPNTAAQTAAAMFNVCAYTERTDVGCALGATDTATGPAGQTLQGCCAQVASPNGYPQFELMFDHFDTWFGADNAQIYLRVQEAMPLEQDACYRLNLWATPSQ